MICAALAAAAATAATGTNARLHHLLSHTCQAVYSFRGARVEHIHDSVERDFSSLSSLVLASNYRSRAPIVRTAEVVLCAQVCMRAWACLQSGWGVNACVAERGLVRVWVNESAWLPPHCTVRMQVSRRCASALASTRLRPSLLCACPLATIQGAPKLHQDAQVTREGRHDTVRMVRVRNDYAEAEEVAHAALQWRDKGRKLSEFAVLYRANYQVSSRVKWCAGPACRVHCVRAWTCVGACAAERDDGGP